MPTSAADESAAKGKKKVGKEKHIALTGSEVKPKLASRIFLIYSGERAFVTCSLVADLPRENTNRYDELVSGRGIYAYVGGNPISNYDPSGLMCIGGVGCYTTDQERAYADKGDYSNYYKTACAGGDAYACFAEHVAANDDFWGHRANNRLRDYMKKKADDSQQCLDEEGIKEKIRKELAKRYADYLPKNPNDARWPSAKDVAKFHWDVFSEFGLPPSTFGGTPFGSTPFLPSIWCPNCQR